MKNKGFTLIEVLAVVAILALLGSIIVPVINGYITDSRQELYDQQVKNIEEAARQWGAKNIGKLPTSTSDEAVTITLGDLIDQGYFAEDVKNPKTKENFSRETSITISYTSKNQLSYTVTVKE